MRVWLPICLLLLTACGDEKQKPVVPVAVTSISQMNREISSRLDEQMAAAEKIAVAKAEEADRIRFAEVLQAPLDKWGALYWQLPGKQLNEVIEIGAMMAAIRVEMNATATTPCTFNARQKIFSGMDQVNAVMEAFKGVTGAVPEELSIKLGIGEAVAREGAGDLIACKEGR